MTTTKTGTYQTPTAQIKIVARRLAHLISVGENVRNTPSWQDALHEVRSLALKFLKAGDDVPRVDDLVAVANVVCHVRVSCVLNVLYSVIRRARANLCAFWLISQKDFRLASALPADGCAVQLGLAGRATVRPEGRRQLREDPGERRLLERVSLPVAGRGID